MADLAELKLAFGDLDEAKVYGILDSFVANNPNNDETQKIVEVCQHGMEIVGEKFENGEYFVGDLIFAGELLSDSIDRLKPLLGDGNAVTRGTIVLGTVEGDIHDIGKNIFKSIAEAAGFKVVDIGIDQAPEAFVEAVKIHKPEIVGLSGVLTLSIDSMKRTVEAFKAVGLRNEVKITIGGNAVSDEACRYVGADAWSKNAPDSIKVCSGWLL
ncbi:MAG: cobalamin-dependent protein [Synergistaceae bacterium]|nr:cobalamin-dependent protein [Synergistaceae bacterium]